MPGKGNPVGSGKSEQICFIQRMNASSVECVLNVVPCRVAVASIHSQPVAVCLSPTNFPFLICEIALNGLNMSCPLAGC